MKPMKPDTPQHMDSEVQLGHEAALVELRLEDLKAVAGGPQIINDTTNPITDTTAMRRDAA